MRNVLLTTITALAIALSGCATEPRTPEERAEIGAALKEFREQMEALTAQSEAKRQARIRAANEHNHSNRPLYCTHSKNRTTCY